MIALLCASQQLDSMELLEEDLTCPICCGLFDDPRVLPCSHSFCKKCLEGMLEGNRSPVWRPPFKCPTCRKETPQNGANSLQVNYSLRGIVEKYNRIRVLPRMSLCKQHDGQPLNIFCATDLKLICGFCATTGNHKGHAFSALDEAYKQEKAAFEQLSEGMESWQNADILSCLETLQGSKKKALQSVSTDAEKVTRYFDNLIGALERKKREILSDFETLKLAVMQAHDPEINALSAALDEQSRALSIARSFGDVSDPLCFLQQMQEFREKLRLVRETPLPSPEDIGAQQGPPHAARNFDVRDWDTLRLRDVDKISVPLQQHRQHHGSLQRHHGSTGSRLRGPKLFFLFMSVVLPAVFLLHPDTLSSASSVHWSFPSGTVLSGLGPYLSDAAGVYWQKGLGACSCLLGTCQHYALDCLHTAADYMGSCKLF